MLALSHGLHGIHRSTQQGKHRPGISGAVRLQHGKMLHLGKGHRSGIQHRGVHFQRRNRQFSVHGGTDKPVHPGTECGNVLFFNRKPGRQLMTAEAIQQVGTALQRGEQVEAAVGTAGTLAHALVDMDHKAGAGELFTESGCNNAHHALMPFFTGQHQCAAVLVPQRLNLPHSIGTDSLLHILTLAIQLTQRPGQLFRLRRVGGHQQVCRQIHLAHTAGSIDPGRQYKADLNGCDGFSQQPHFFQKCVDTHKIRVVQRFQTAIDNGAVLSLHQHHIGNGSDGSQCTVAGKERILSALAAQCQNQFQSHAHAGQMPEGIGAVLPMGIHHRHRVGQRLFALVMVGNDHIHTQRIGVVHFLVSGDAAVHGDHQRGTLLPQAQDGLIGKAVAILNAAGNIAQTANTAALEIIHDHHRRGDAIHIVVTEHGNGFPISNGALDPGHRLIHILHQQRRN